MIASSAHSQTEAAIWGPRVGVDADSFALFGYGIPGSVVGFEMNLLNRRDVLQQFLADLVDDLLDAAGFKPRENFMHDFAHCGSDRAVAERGLRAGAAPFEIEPHVQWTIPDFGKRGVPIANEAAESTAAQTQKFETLNAGTDFYGV